MSAPPSGSANGTPSAGYYPDPSIPGYVRYWNGAAWVPGTSRPAPQEGEPLPAPPSAAASQAAPAPTAAEPAPAEETGPVFLDEDAGMAAGPEPASAWQADAARQEGFAGQKEDRISWGSRGAEGAEDDAAQPDGGTFQMRSLSPQQPKRQSQQGGPAQEAAGRGTGGSAAAPEYTVGLRRSDVLNAPGAAQSPAPAAPEQSAPAPQSGRPAPQPPAQQPPAQQPPAQSVPAQSAPAPSAPAPSPPAQEQPATTPPPQQQHWAQQVHDLAAHSSGAGSGAPGVPGPPRQPVPPQQQSAGPESVTPWRPPVNDPFLQAAQEQARPAGLGKRFTARLIDGALTGAVAAGVAFPFVGMATEHIQRKIDAVKAAGRTETVWLLDGTTGGYLAIVLGALLVFGLLYEVLPTARWGRTLGKKLLGLRVLDVEQQDTPGFGASLKRWLVYGVLGTLAIGVLNIAWCLFDRPWRQCWHDKAARTFVSKDAGATGGLSL